ncbi:MAG: hypothetical protein IKT14_04315 [Clostridiales bacterium]|nr:hypothetical protein [Clostridiales bacterium]
MKTVLTKVMSAAVCTVMAVAGFSGFTSLKKDVNAAYLTPRLIVTGSEITTGDINAGEDFELKVHLKNESTATKLYNIRLEFSSEDNEIYPVDGTNVIYVDSADKEEEFDVTIEMATRGDLEQKPYTLNVNYEYEDNDRNSFEDSSEIAIPVLQEPDLSLSDMKLTKHEIELNNKTSFSMQLNNMGKGSIYNVSVSVDGDLINDADTVVGNIDMGDNTTVDLSLKGTATGSGDINITVKYEDADGKSYEITKSMGLTVVEPAPVEVAEEASSSGLALLLVSGVVIAAVIVIVNVVRKKKEKAYA